MKKVLLVAVLSVFTFTANAQSFSVGVNVGLPTGDMSDFSSLALGADVNYMFASDTEISFGVSAGVINYFGKDVTILGITVDLGNVTFLPLAGAVRYSLSEKFNLGADLGYAVGINDGNEGGFYYKPMIGYRLSEKMELNASYSGVSSDGITASNFGVGIMFGL